MCCTLQRERLFQHEVSIPVCMGAYPGKLHMFVWKLLCLLEIWYMALTNVPWVAAHTGYYLAMDDTSIAKV
jgi:hypothetical protein